MVSLHSVKVKLNNLVENYEDNSVKRIFDINKHVKYIFLLSKYIGIFPYTIRNGEFRFSPPYFIICLVMMTFSCYFFVDPIYNLIYFPKVWTFSYTVSTTTTLLQGLLYSFLCVYNMVSSSSLNRTFRELRNVERTLLRLKVPWTCSNKDWPKNLLAFTAWGINVSIISFLRRGGFDAWSLNVYYQVIFCSQMLLTSQYSSMAGLLAAWLDAAGSSLRPALAPDLVQFLEHTNNAATALQKHFSLYILFFVSSNFINTTSSAFLIINQIFFPQNSTGVMLKDIPKPLLKLFPILRILWCSANLILLWKLLSATNRVKRKANGLYTSLYRLMINGRKNSIIRDKRLSLLFSMKREINFSVCGFFELDYTLVHSMMASVVSYLVILIQFGQPDPSSQENGIVHSTDK